VVLKKEIELNTIVKILGPHLTSDDENTRSRGYEIFSGSLEWVEDSDVSEQNAASLMKFYSNRINDFLCLPDLIPGALTCIQKFSNVKKDDVVYFMIQLFSEASVMSLSQPVRLLIFQILNTILVKFPESKNRFLFNMNSQFAKMNLFKVSFQVWMEKEIQSICYFFSK
jgi:hypothetical protein